MKFLGIEFGGIKQEIIGSENGGGDLFEIRSGSRVQKIRQGAELVEIRGKSKLVEKNQVNPEVYRDMIDY